MNFQSVTIGLSCLAIVAIASGCDAGHRERLVTGYDQLRQQNETLSRDLADRDRTVASLELQIEDLTKFDDKTPADLFAVTKLEFVRLTGGADYDGLQGHDGVTVHLRLRDADGDIHKAAGQFTIQLVDNRDMGSPRVLGVYEFHDPEKVKKAWFGKFGTSHFTFKCPFKVSENLAGMTSVDVKAEFLDYLTGKRISAIKQVSVSIAAN